MIKRRLLHPLREPRERRRHARGGRGLGATLRKPGANRDRVHAAQRSAHAAGGRPPAPASAPKPRQAQQQAARTEHGRFADPAVERVRGAGGPIDHAAYACSCGFQFSAAVSTTVACPHCGADQAW